VDLLIAEWRLCRQEGHDLLARLREQVGASGRARIPVIVLGSKPEEQEGAAQAGADVFLRRPFPAKGLLQTLEALVEPTP
jgi:DNA-binding response OmpR family regulator